MFVPEVDVADDFIRGGDGGGERVTAIAFVFIRETHVVVEFIIGGEFLGDTA